MASSLSVTTRLTATLDFAGTDTQPFQIPQTAWTLAMAGKYVTGGTITVPTSDTTLSKGSITTVGYIYVINLDDTNYVQVGDGTNWLFRALPAGPPVMGFYDTGTPHVKAHTNACDIYYALFEA